MKIAVNVDVKIPIINVVAKPTTGPLTKKNKINALLLEKAELEV